MLLPTLLLIGCGSDAAWPPVQLSGDDQATAHGRLKEDFTGIHDHEFEVPGEFRSRINDAVAPLVEQLDPVPEISVLLVNNPDADAGCIAGGQLFLSLGLIAFTERPEELAGILALALTACGAANEDWRRRERNQLPEIVPGNVLMIVYRDLRLREQAALYSQLVRRGCGRGRDCHEQARELLDEAGVGVSGLNMLLTRIGSEWPDAAVLQRFGAPQQSLTGDARRDAEFMELLEPFSALREVLGDMRVARWEWFTGELIEAHRANIRASMASSDFWLPVLMQARLDVANVHPHNAMRLLAQVEGEYTDRAGRELLRGVAMRQKQRVQEARSLLESSAQARATVSAHYYLGLIFYYLREPEFERAKEHLRTAAEGGDLHPYARDAAVRLAALEDGGMRQSRR